MSHNILNGRAWARPHRLAAAVMVGLVGVTASACSNDAPVDSATPSATGTGTLTIGIAFDEPGVGLKSGNTYTGFDVDVATYVAGKLGVKPENITWKEAKPAERETLLESGDVDMVVATYSITDVRKQQVDFAGPYYTAHQDLLIRRNDDSIEGPETLDKKVLCSVTGTTSAAFVSQKYAGRITLQEKPRFSDCVNALVQGDVDAVTTDDLILAGFAAQEQYKGILRLVGDGFTDEHYGIGLKKGSTDTVTKVNAALTSFIEDGSWERSLDANVGDSGFAIPDPPPVGG